MSAVGPEPPRRPASTRSHQVHRFLGRLHEVLDEVGTETVWALPPAELGECLIEAYAAQARLSALTLALLAQAETSGLATHDGEVNLVAWLRDRVRLAPAEGRRQIRLAHRIEQHTLVREALAAGAFPTASATVITEALHKLPPDLDAGLLRRAEEHLTGEAHAHDTHQLRRLADHLEEVLDPEGHDARLAAQLAREQARAERRAFLTLHHDETTATTEGHFRLPLLSGLTLQRMLESLTNPGRPDPIALTDPDTDPDTGTRLAAEERRGRALVELIDRYPTRKLPKLGGSAPTVVVTMSLACLEGRLEAAHLDTGQAISAGLARRLAAQHGLIPAVLGTDSEVLDLGRTARLHTTKQRLAMLLQQHGTCAVQGCTRTAIGADAHHLIAWSHGGPTTTTDGALLCPPHHTLADHPDYHVTRLRPGRIRINRRC